MDYIPVIIWTLLSLIGIRVTARSIARNTIMLETARKHNTDIAVLRHLDNVLFMYKSRLWLIVNNLLIGIVAAMSMVGLFNFPQLLGLYITVSLLVNEAVLIYLTYRDQRVENKKANGE